MESSPVREETRAMTKAELIERVAVATDVTKKQAEAIVDTVFEAIVRSLKEGQSVKVKNGMIFNVTATDKS